MLLPQEHRNVTTRRVEAPPCRVLETHWGLRVCASKSLRELLSDGPAEATICALNAIAAGAQK